MVSGSSDGVVKDGGRSKMRVLDPRGADDRRYLVFEAAIDACETIACVDIGDTLLPVHPQLASCVVAKSCRHCRWVGRGLSVQSKQRVPQASQGGAAQSASPGCDWIRSDAGGGSGPGARRQRGLVA